MVQRLLQVGDAHEKLAKYCKMKVGIPIKPMLAKPTTGVHIVLERFAGIEFTCEYKYDGFRGQIHYQRHKDYPKVDIYSRNLENMTVAYPDVIAIIKKIANQDMKGITNFIIDCELIAYDKEKDKILPFQSLSGRSRKHVSEKDLQTKIAVMPFDLLYLNNTSLLKETFEKRRKLLHTTFKEQ